MLTPSPIQEVEYTEPVVVGLELLSADGALMLLVGVLVLLLGLIAWQLRRLLQDVEGQGTSLGALRGLEQIERHVERLAQEGDELDMRRLEHVVIDIRDGLRRLEERIVAVMEGVGQTDHPATGSGSGPLRAASLSERVTSRLLSMGFERIQVLSSLDELEDILAQSEGEVRVEARRSGASHKGRVLVRDGAIADTRMREGYEAFP